MNILPTDVLFQENVMVVGAGGGFDFVCGLPILLELENRGCSAIIGNYSFTNLTSVTRAELHTAHLLKVNADSIQVNNGYFPEKHLSAWYRKEKRIEKDVWCFSMMGVVPTLESYNYLIDKFNIDTVICVDGGVDGIFRGDEFDLGTPSMDAISVIATSLCKAKNKYYVCTAFGIEGSESRVSHAQVLNRMADLIKVDALLGVSVLTANSDIGKSFLSATQFIFRNMNPNEQSTIVSSIAESIRGGYGYSSVNGKTQERQVWISPLTALYWFFSAKEVAEIKLFYNQALSSQTVGEVGSAIESLRNKIGVKPHETIPV